MDKQIEKYTKEIDKCRLRLEKEREILRDLIDKLTYRLEELEQSTTDGIEGIIEAIVILNDAFMDMNQEK